MKTNLTLILVLVVTNLAAQEQHYTKNGHIDFYSHTPLEDITASNDQVAAFLNTSNGELNFALLMKSFQFEKALMQEHFNENYVESDVYPKASFKGTIENFSALKLEEGTRHSVTVSGTLNLHGVSREIKVPASIIMKDDLLIAESRFILKPEDYKINIPKAVRENIAKEIEVSVQVNLKPYIK